jgi:hypothetical protein
MLAEGEFDGAGEKVTPGKKYDAWTREIDPVVTFLTCGANI